jgi:hypothetical protein
MRATVIDPGAAGKGVIGRPQAFRADLLNPGAVKVPDGPEDDVERVIDLNLEARLKLP